MTATMTIGTWSGTTAPRARLDALRGESPAQVVAAVLDGCSPATLDARFRSGARPGPAAVRYLAAPGEGSRVWAVHDGDRWAALAHIIREPGTDSTEVAVLVADSAQRDGIGAALTDELFIYAQMTGVTVMHAYIPTGNHAAWALLEHAARDHDADVTAAPHQAQARIAFRRIASAH